MANIDIFVIVSSCISLLVFWVFQIVKLRSVDNSKAAAWSIAIYKWGILGNFIISFFLYAFFVHGLWLNALLLMLFSGFLYLSFGLIAYLFIFGIAFTSVRTQLLYHLHSGGKKGLTYDQILKKYNKDIMVKRRLERLIQYGAITCRRGKYQATNALSLISLANYILVALRKIYFRNQ